MLYRFRPRLEALEDRAVPATIVVNSAADTIGVAGQITLRGAILSINQQGDVPNVTHTGTYGTADTIQFAIGSIGSKATISIALSGLEPLIKPMLIDGLSQGGTGYSGLPLITLNGSLAGQGATGLTIDANSCTVRGLAIGPFSGTGVHISGGNNTISDNVISGNTGLGGQRRRCGPSRGFEHHGGWHRLRGRQPHLRQHQQWHRDLRHRWPGERQPVSGQPDRHQCRRHRRPRQRG
jgi:hypothetical protein